MSLSDLESIDAHEAAPGDAVRALFAEWGLGVGGTVLGWRIDDIDVRGDDGCVVNAELSSASAVVSVRFRLASDAPHFARLGAIDVSHGKIATNVSGAVASLLKHIVGVLKARDAASALAPLLTGTPTRTGPRQASSKPRANEGALGAAHPYVVVHDAPPLDPAKQAPPDRPVIRFDFIEVEDLPKYPNALREIFDGTRGGLVIRGVYTEDEMKRVVARLERAEGRFPKMDLPPVQASYFLGLCLECADPSLVEYLDSAAVFRKETLPIFEGMAPFEPRVEGLFRALSGGRPVRLVESASGQPYIPATIRILPPGGQMAPHCGNEMYRRPAYEYLNSIVDQYDQLSYFLTLQEPEAGGGLIIYSLEWSSVGPDHILPDERSNVGSLLGEVEWTEIRTRPGDVLIFDGGRYLHRVDWVRGERTRWTMGGFLMFDRPGETVLYFA